MQPSDNLQHGLCAGQTALVRHVTCRDFEAFKDVMLSYKKEAEHGGLGFEIHCHAMKVCTEEQVSTRVHCAALATCLSCELGGGFLLVGASGATLSACHMSCSSGRDLQQPEGQDCPSILMIQPMCHQLSLPNVATNRY